MGKWMGGAMLEIDAMLQVGRTFGVRDGMLRLQYELQRGTGLMSWKMRSVQGWHSWSLNRIAPGVLSQDMSAARWDATPRFVLTDAPTMGTNIKKIPAPDVEDCVVAEAGRILLGNLPYFG